MPSLPAQLGQKLRILFADVDAQPVPDRLAELLEALATKEKKICITAKCLSKMPCLRRSRPSAFAISLCGDLERADDLVHKMLLRHQRISVSSWLKSGLQPREYSVRRPLPHTRSLSRQCSPPAESPTPLQFRARVCPSKMTGIVKNEQHRLAETIAIPGELLAYEPPLFWFLLNRRRPTGHRHAADLLEDVPSPLLE